MPLIITRDTYKCNTVNRPDLNRHEDLDSLYLIHIYILGDFAYDFEQDNGRVGDEFMRQIEPVATYVPYMTCPGNHENA